MRIQDYDQAYHYSMILSPMVLMTKYVMIQGVMVRHVMTSDYMEHLACNDKALS